ncbi:MAG: hypothetical protein E2O29_02180 [Deltaproteobacteria bacterium]|nr:MAG: hypothetical protein E2O29_02180 [Deltaproteobacteria bacterium]
MLIDDERNKQLDIALSKKYTKSVKIVTRDEINKILVDTRENKQVTSSNKKPRGTRNVANTSIQYSLSQSKSLKVQKERGWFGDNARHAEAARGARGTAWVGRTALLSLGAATAIQIAKPVIRTVAAGIRGVKAGAKVVQRGIKAAESVGRAGQRVVHAVKSPRMKWAVGIAASGILLSRLRRAKPKGRQPEPPQKFLKQISTPEDDGNYVANVLRELGQLSEKEKKKLSDSLNDKEKKELNNILDVIPSVKGDQEQETKKDAAASAVNPREKGKEKVRKEYSGQNLTDYPNMHSNPPDGLPGNEASTEKIRLGQVVQELVELIHNLEELQTRGQIQGIITERDTDELVTPILEEAQHLLSSIDPSRKASDSEQQLLRVDKVIRREDSGYALHFSDGRKEKFATRGAAENRERQIQYFKHKKSFEIIYDKLDKLTVEKGWIGDAVRHAEAARRGWAGRGGKKQDTIPKAPEPATRRQQRQSQRREQRISRLSDASVNAQANNSVNRAERKLTNIGKGIVRGTAGNTAKVVSSTVGIFGDLGSDAAIGVIGSAFTLAALGIKPNEILGVGLFSASRVLRGITKLPKLKFLKPIERPISIALFKMGRKLKGIKTLRSLRRK